MSWRINYGQFGATSPRAGLPLPDPEAASAAVASGDKRRA